MSSVRTPIPVSSDARRFTAGRRRRRLTILLSSGTLVALVLLVTGIVMSPLLTLTHVVVKGREDVPERVIVGAVSDQIGRPLAAIDFDRIRDRLATVTRIQSFTTEIQPPHTLVIRVVERRAIGFFAVKSKWAIVDAAGVVVDTVSAPPSRIPELFVESTTDRAFTSIAETLSQLPSTIRNKVLSISAQSRDSVTFTLRNSGHIIIWGSPDNSALKVLVMGRALKVADRSSGRYSIDVSAPDNIVLQRIS